MQDGQFPVLLHNDDAFLSKIRLLSLIDAHQEAFSFEEIDYIDLRVPEYVIVKYDD